MFHSLELERAEGLQVLVNAWECVPLHTELGARESPLLPHSAVGASGQGRSLEPV